MKPVRSIWSHKQQVQCTWLLGPEAGSVISSSTCAGITAGDYFWSHINNSSDSADVRPTLMSPVCACEAQVLNNHLNSVRNHDPVKVKGGGCSAVRGVASCCWCCCCSCSCLKAGFTSSLLTEIPTTSLPPRHSWGHCQRCESPSSVAINLNK